MLPHIEIDQFDKLIIAHNRMSSNSRPTLIAMKINQLVIFLIVALCQITFVHAQDFAAVINDPDGFVNVRQSPSTQSTTMGKIFDGEDLLVNGSSGQWYHVVSMSKQGTWTKGFVHGSRIERVDFRTVVVDGKSIKYRLILDPAVDKNLPQAKCTSDRSYAINPFSGEKMYFGFLRTQAIITDPITGREFAYTQETQTEHEAINKTADARQDHRPAKTELEKQTGVDLTEFGRKLFQGAKIVPAKYEKCDRCDGTGRLSDGSECPDCDGTGRIRLGPIYRALTGQ